MRPIERVRTQRLVAELNRARAAMGEEERSYQMAKYNPAGGWGVFAVVMLFVFVYLPLVAWWNWM